jgi:hypothetical protein
MRRSLLVVAAFSLAACVTTQEMPIAPNMVRIDTRAGGLLYQGKAVPATMTAAANATLARGYTHFKLDQVGISQGSEVTGANAFGGNGWASANVNRTHVENSAATVVMFHADEPGAKGAFEASQVLAQYAPQGS